MADEIARTTMLIRPEAFLQAISAFVQATNSPEAVEAFRNSVAGHVAYRPEDAGHLIRVEIVVERWPWTVTGRAARRGDG